MTRHIFHMLEQFTRSSPDITPSEPITSLDARLPINVPIGTQLASFNSVGRSREYLRFVMGKAKQRAVSILLFLGTVLVLIAAWDVPESPAPSIK
jgi:hypothetical protein